MRLPTLILAALLVAVLCWMPAPVQAGPRRRLASRIVHRPLLHRVLHPCQRRAAFHDAQGMPATCGGSLMERSGFTHAGIGGQPVIVPLHLAPRSPFAPPPATRPVPPGFGGGCPGGVCPAR